MKKYIILISIYNDWKSVFKLLKNIEGGFVIIGDIETLSQICGGIFFEVEAQGICMIGKKK